MSIQVLPENQGGLFNRLGRGFGQGLAQSIPKEVERSRLAKGLKQFETESANLSPIQQLSQLSTIPGITPQMIQSFGELAKQQQKGVNLKNLKKSDEVKPSPFKSRSEKPPGGKGEEIPSITTAEPIEATVEPYIPKTQEQIYEEAGRMFEENPALFANNADNAIQAAVQADAREQGISQALQAKRQSQTNVQNTTMDTLRRHSDRLNVKIPENVYSKIENEALDAVNPKKLGGKGLTEQQAAKIYGDKLDTISRDYQGLKDLGGFSIINRSPEANKNSIKSLQKKFNERKDLENFADSLISTNKLSPGKAYYMAYPVSDIKPLNNEISKLPTLETTEALFESKVHPDISREKTLSISKKLASLMGKEGSPLSIAEELNAKNYDPEVWLDYINKNRDELDLTERQVRELEKPRNWFSTLSDLWMFSLSGLDKLVEK